MYDGTKVLGKQSHSSGEHAETVVETAHLRVEVVRLSGGEGLEWQRTPIADRVFIVTEGRGFCYRSHGRDEIRDEISAGDIVPLKRYLWHRLVAAPDGTLTGSIVTSPPGEIEFRR
jgi:quercetin dioxygenase-like cupin family protein